MDNICWLPTSLGTACRWVKDTNRALNGTGRRLNSATISKGGMAVYRNGKVIVEDGNVTIIDGNLVLSKGSISGDALKEHLSYAVAGGQKQYFGSPNRLGQNKWEIAGSLTLTPPTWAKRALIYANCEFHGVWKPQLSDNDDWQGQVRFNLHGRTSPATFLRFNYSGSETYFEAMIQLAHTLNITGTVTIEVEHWLVGTQSSLYEQSKSWIKPQAVVTWIN